MRKKIFSGEGSEEFWRRINHAKDISELRDALYLMGCKLQELEAEVEKLNEKTKENSG